MKIQVKTLNQKSFSVDIDEQKSVYDLKQELTQHADVGVKPEQQNLIYAGRMLGNDEILKDCNIDEKKFVVVMILKEKPKENVDIASASSNASTSTQQTAAGEQKSQQSTTEEAAAAAEKKTSTVQPTNTEHDEMVANIMNMGYAEADVRQALEASFYNAERAVEYLIEGLPDIPGHAGGMDVDDGENSELSPLKLFRSDPVFRNLRSLIKQNPELINDAVERISEANPALLTIINEHHDEFLNMLFEEENDDDEID